MKNNRPAAPPVRLDERGLEGLQHSPDRLVRNLVATALFAQRRLDSMRARVRQLEEQIAAQQLAGDPVLVLVDHRGFVQVKAKDYFPVKVVEVNDVDGNPDHADAVALLRTPPKFRELWHCKSIAIGGPALDRCRYEAVENRKAAIRLLRELEEGLKNDRVVAGNAEGSGPRNSDEAGRVSAPSGGGPAVASEGRPATERDAGRGAGPAAGVG